MLNIIKDAGNKGPNLKNKKFAVIIDEAHSSTAGENMSALKETLAGKTLDEAAKDQAEKIIYYEDDNN